MNKLLFILSFLALSCSNNNAKKEISPKSNLEKTNSKEELAFSLELRDAEYKICEGKTHEDVFYIKVKCLNEFSIPLEKILIYSNIIELDFTTECFSKETLTGLNRFKKLKTVNLAGIGEHSDFLELNFLSQIEHLTLSGTYNMPTSIGGLKNLKHLHMPYGPDSIPLELYNCTKLETVKFYTAIGLDSIPKGIGALTQLRELIISKSNALSFPDDFFTLSNLEKISFSTKKDWVLWEDKYKEKIHLLKKLK